MQEVDDFHPLEFKVIENSNPGNISVRIEHIKKKSDNIYINVSKGGGYLRLECNKHLDKALSAFDTPYEDWYKHNYNNEWMKIETSGKYIDITFFNDVDYEGKNAKISFRIDSLLALTATLVIQRNP